MKQKEILAFDVNVAALSTLLGVTQRRVRQLAEEGVVVKGQARGRYDLMSSVQNYIRALTDRIDTTTLDDLRREKLAVLQIARAQKDRQLISLEEALGAIDEITGLFVASLNSLPAQITGVPRERQRLNDIFDAERQRLADRLQKKVDSFAAGQE